MSLVFRASVPLSVAVALLAGGCSTRGANGPAAGGAAATGAAGAATSAATSSATSGAGAAAASTAPANAQADESTMKGKIASLNYGNRGQVESFMLTVGDKTVQIVLPNEMAAAGYAIHAGDEVTVTAGENGPGGPGGPGDGRGAGPGGPGGGRGPQVVADHEIYQAGTLKDAQGHTYSRHGPGDHVTQLVKVESTIAAINYDHRGQADGIQLANGDLVHLGNAAGQMKLAAKQAVVVEGEAETLPSGVRMIQPTTINGAAVAVGEAGPGRGGPGGRRGGPGGPGDALGGLGGILDDLGGLLDPGPGRDGGPGREGGPGRGRGAGPGAGPQGQPRPAGQLP